MSCQPDKEEVQENAAITGELPYQPLSLDDMSAFRATEAGNWQVAGAVFANRHEDSHLQTEAGRGILANLPDENQRDNLFTAFDHGDIELQLDFMMPKGSNSGIYLMGRYEVQLLDSWGKDSLKFGDCGAIYARYDEEKKQAYEGQAPPINASRAPGLWQHMHIKFRAPRFDAQGNKVKNAVFEEVLLNGSLLHENVEVSGPTRAAAFDDEKPAGPLMIQGDHGPVAIRNIRYKRYGEQQLSISDMQYAVYEGIYENFDTLNKLQPDKTATIDSISAKFYEGNEALAARFTGTLNVPEGGDYLFELASWGPALLLIHGDTAVHNDESQEFRDTHYGKISLQEGAYPLEFTFLKNERPWRKGLKLYYEGPGIHKSALHAANSEPTSKEATPILVHAAERPAMQRGFVMHRGQKHTHTTTVGTPEGIHYALALNSGSLLSGWRGDFVDCEQMWDSRGVSQLIKPQGNQVEFSARPMVAVLPDEEAAWPDSVAFETDQFSFSGYRLEESGLPTFLYRAGTAEIRDQLRPNSEKHGLSRTTRIQNHDASDGQLYVMLAEGSIIEELPDGSFGIDDRSYYLELEEPLKAQAFIRSDRAQQQLLLPVADASADISYDIIW